MEVPVVNMQRVYFASIGKNVVDQRLLTSGIPPRSVIPPPTEPVPLVAQAEVECFNKTCSNSADDIQK